MRALVQCLVDGQLEPEVFTTRLVNALNCSPQPMMIPFLKTSLPHLQSSLAARELTIEGLQPPTANQAQTKARNPPIALPNIQTVSDKGSNSQSTPPARPAQAPYNPDPNASSYSLNPPTEQTNPPSKHLEDFIKKQIAEKEAELECPVCLEVAAPPILMCSELHLICSDCRPKLKKCPVCRKSFRGRGVPKRHRFAEQMVQDVENMRKELRE